MKNDAKNMCQGNEETLMDGSFVALSNGKSLDFYFCSEKRRRREQQVYWQQTTMAIRSVRIQTSENQKKTLNFLFLSFCVHIHKERER